MENNPLVWFGICVQDMKRAKAFYESMLDIRLTRMESPLAN